MGTQTGRKRSHVVTEFLVDLCMYLAKCMPSHLLGRVFLWARPARVPTISQSIFVRMRMLRLPLFDRFVMCIFCRGTIAVFAEKFARTIAAKSCTNYRASQ